MPERAAPASPARPPRIVHLLFGGLGGHGSVAFSLIEASRGAAVHELAFVSTGALLPEYRDKCRRDGITYVHERTSGGADLGYQWRLFRWVLGRRPDTVVVHSTGTVGAALAVRLLRRRTRVVVVEHQSWELRSPRYDAATALALVAADHVLVLNDDYARRLKAHFPHLSRRVPIDVVRNGIDVDTFSPGTPERGPRSGPLRIGMQSRLSPIKDHATLIRAVHRLQTGGLDVRLLLAGDGSSRAGLEALVEELGLGASVTFLGMLAEPDLIDFLRGLDVYVHASLGEAMSTALLQAMACELPVVASDVPGISDLVAGHGVAVLVPPQDPDALASTIGTLSADPQRRARLAGAARAFVVDGFSLQRMWESYGPHLRGRPTTTVDDPEPVTSPMESLLLRTYGPRNDRPALESWPNRARPRVSFPVGDVTVARWFQRSGLLGGGGTDLTRRLWRRVPVSLLLRLRRVRESLRGAGT